MIYNCFTSNNPNLKAIGNPSAVFFIENETEVEMSRLAMKAGTPISCFVKLQDETSGSASVKFFAPNGKKEGFCGHGLISIAKALKDKGLTQIKTVLTEAGIFVKLSVLENGISSLEIPTQGFGISEFENSKTVNQVKNLFNLNNEVLEVFKADNLGDLLFELNSPETLQNLKFKKEDLLKFLMGTNPRVLSFFCKGSAFSGIDIEIRVFYVNLENLEDIVCGSVNIGISKILYAKYGITSYKSVQPFNYTTTGKVGGYQEIAYNPSTKILTINGFTEPKEQRFIFEPLNIEFDENLNPISKNEDYNFFRSILTDPEVMKTSTAFAGGTPENDYDLHNLMNALVEKDERFKNDYGFQKIWHTGLKEYVGVMGLVRTESNFTEGAILLKSKYIGSGIGFWAEKCLFENLERLNGIMIASVWEGNKASIKLMKKNGMSFVKKSIKSYHGKVVFVDFYVKLPKHYSPDILTQIENFLIAGKLSEVKQAA